MKKYTLADLQVIDSIDAIKKWPKLYLDPNIEQLDSIVLQLTLNMVYYKVIELTVIRYDKFVLLYTYPDWVLKGKEKIETVFSKLCSHPNLPVNTTRAEVLLTAFDYQYYTFGKTGSFGDEKLLEVAKQHISKKYMQPKGRVLLISTHIIDNLST